MRIVLGKTIGKLAENLNVKLEELILSCISEISHITNIEFDKIEIKSRDVGALARYFPESNSLRIRVSPVYLTAEDKDKREKLLKYIFKHEILEAALTKPSKIKQKAHNVIEWSPVFEITTMETEVKKGKRDLGLQSKRLCQDLEVDRRILKDQEAVQGFLTTHDSLYNLDKNKLEKIETEVEGNTLLVNTNPSDLLALYLSTLRRCKIAVETEDMCEGFMKSYSSKYRQLYRDNIVNRTLEFQHIPKIESAIDNIESEVDRKTKPSWRKIYSNTKYMLDQMEEATV